MKKANVEVVNIKLTVESEKDKKIMERALVILNNNGCTVARKDALVLDNELTQYMELNK
jgi:hypothetical protein